MKHFHLVSVDAYASGLTAGTTTLAGIADLAEGAFVLINKDTASADYNKSVDVAASSLPTIAAGTFPAKFQIVTKSKNGLKYSPVFTSTQATAKTVAYSAAVAKVVVVGNDVSGETTKKYNLPTIAVGDVFGVTVINTDKPVGTLLREKAYTVEAVTGSTGATLQAALIAKINADANAIVTAAAAYSGATDGFKLTSDVAGVNFQVAPIGILRSASITDQDTIGTENAVAQGNAAQMKDLEKFDLVERGLDDARLSDLTTWTTDVAAAGTYDQTIIRGKVDYARPFVAGANEDVELTIAILSTLTVSSTADKSKRAALCIVTELSKA